MKKLLSLLLVMMCALGMNAQGIYTKVTKYDKFDDVVWKRQIKTLITQTDTTFVVETKGSKPETYYYTDNFLMADHIGRRDSLANLVADLWGYEDVYTVYTENLRKEISSKIKNVPDTMTPTNKVNYVFEEVRKILKRCPKIVIRNISKYSFSYEYKTDLFWIKFNDGTRLIYEKY